MTTFALGMACLRVSIFWKAQPGKKLRLAGSTSSIRPRPKPIPTSVLMKLLVQVDISWRSAAPDLEIGLAENVTAADDQKAVQAIRILADPLDRLGQKVRGQSY